MAPTRPRRIHWAWLPAAIAYAVPAWIKWGPLIALSEVGAGLGFGLLIEWRARRRH